MRRNHTTRNPHDPRVIREDENSSDRGAIFIPNKATITAESGKQEPSLTREFDALRELVFKASIDPSLHVQWIWLRGLTTMLEKFGPKKWKLLPIHPERHKTAMNMHIME